MKKPRLSILVAVTLLFAVFTLGFFLGRNGSHGSVELSVPAAMQTLPPQTTCPEPTTPETVAVTFPIDINRRTRSSSRRFPALGRFSPAHRRLPGGKRQLSFHPGATECGGHRGKAIGRHT